MAKIIGLCGKIKTGKSVVSDILMEELDGQLWKISFADTLKEEVAELFNFDVRYCYDQKLKNKVITVPIEIQNTYKSKAKMTVREIMQYWGTDIRRTEDPFYWDNLMRAKLKENSHYDYIIIDDVRFPSELKLIKELGGVVYRLEPYEGWTGSPGFNDHPSETALDDHLDYDCIFYPKFGELNVVASFIMKFLEEECT